MCRTFPTCEAIDVVMKRIAGEIGSAADELADVEAHVAAMIGGAAPTNGFERLQSLDRLGQQLRKRLGGGRTHAPAAAEPELW